MSLARMKIVTGIIVSGTGLSMDIIKVSLGSFSAKPTEALYVSKVFSDTGGFFDSECQKNYVQRYLKLSDTSSDKRLLERILHWLPGRYVCRSGL